MWHTLCVASGPSQDWTPVGPTIKVQWSRIIAIIGHSSPVTSNICFKEHPTPPPTTPNHFGFISRSQSWNDNSRKQFLGSSKNLSEHLLEEVNWLFCRRLSALSFPPPPLLAEPPTQSTQGNVVNFCYDRLRDNPTIAKHFVYLSHSHKSSRILKAEKEKAREKIFWTGLVVGWCLGHSGVIAPPTGSILRWHLTGPFQFLSSNQRLS